MEVFMKVKKIVLIGLFIALSAIGANIKIFQTVAFDSMPGFLSAIILGPLAGAVVGAIGHLISSTISGFPMSLPVHLAICIDMALTMYFFGITYKVLRKKGELISNISSAIVGALINGPISVFMLLILNKFMAFMPNEVLIGMIPVLTMVAAFNIIIALIVNKFIPENYKTN